MRQMQERRRQYEGTNSHSPGIIRARLTSDFDADGMATAVLLRWDTTQDPPALLETDQAIEAWDAYLSQWWKEDDYVYCTHLADAKRYEVLAEFAVSYGITVTLPSALLASETSKADCVVQSYWGGYDPGSTVTVYNDLGFVGDNNALAIAFWRDRQKAFFFDNVECTAAVASAREQSMAYSNGRY